MNTETPVHKILVLVDFSPCSNAALDYALSIADQNGADVEVLHVWSPQRRDDEGSSTIFADTPEGIAMEQLLSAAECRHSARVCGRLEFGEDASSVILGILDREPFDLVVMGLAGEGQRRDPGERSAPESGRVATGVARTTACRVVTMPPPALPAEGIVAA